MATLVLRGGYEEAGDRGRIRVRAGDIVVYAAFEAHQNRFARGGARIFSLDLPLLCVPRSALCRVEEFDRVLRLAERDRTEAAALLLESMKPVQPEPTDWQEQLAAEILRGEAPCLARWGEDHGLAPESVSRGFRAVFGVAPRTFRTEQRAREAWFRICSTNQPLVEIALDLSFSDQPHMTRAVAQLTSLPPAAWRRCTSSSFKTPEAGPARLAA